MQGENTKFSYETLWKFIIRPPKDDYNEKMLGCPQFKYNRKKYQRKDYEIMSSQGYMMKCSFIEPFKEYRAAIEMPVVLYLHGNSSSRLEGLNIAAELLKRDINLFVIDFPGCGLSEGEYISLGYHESDDVGNVINFLEKLPGVGNIGLWGRSMGAATTMIYAHRDNRVKAICLDSPFADFNKLAKELTLKQVNLPGILINGALSIVRSTILKKNGLDIDKLKPIDAAEKTFQPAIFIHAINDELINVQHSIELFNRYGGQEKSLKCCDKGGHNTKRSTMILNEIGEFFKKYLFLKDEDMMSINNNDDKNTFYSENTINFEKKDVKNINFNKIEIKENLKNKENKDNRENKNKINKNLRRNTIESEEDPFNDTLEKIEYFKKKEQTERKQIDEIEYLLKSIREPDIEMTINNNIDINKDERSSLNNNSNNNINNNNNQDKNIDNNNKNENNNKHIINNSNINFNNWKNGGRSNSKNNFQFQFE